MKLKLLKYLSPIVASVAPINVVHVWQVANHFLGKIGMPDEVLKGELQIFGNQGMPSRST